MSERTVADRLTSELRSLRARISELECKVKLMSGTVGSLPSVPLTPAVWRGEVFSGEITVDNQDGTYQAKRLLADGTNSFTDDTEDTTQITVGNVSERGGYVGELSVGDVVLIRFDGLTSQGDPIYHVW